MKKIFAIIMTICLMASALCVTAFAAPASVLRVSGQKQDGTVEKIQSFSVFDDGWNFAMKHAIDHDGFLKEHRYTRIVVDLLTDWNAVDGQFTDDFFNGKGFDWDTIYIDDDAKITLNLNGYTINRGLKAYQYNGEVIFIDTGADVIINGGKDGDPIVKIGEEAGDVKMGAITGGFSCNGAGGIHINSDATVTLNNVRLVGNTVEDDKGSAIAVYGDAKLTMNGGCLSENNLKAFEDTWQWCEGTLYVSDSTAVLNDVTISGNEAKPQDAGGVAVSVHGKGDVTLNQCLVEKNGTAGDSRAQSVFYSDDKNCVLTLNYTDVKNNGRALSYGGENAPSALFRMTGTLNMNGCTVQIMIW